MQHCHQSYTRKTLDPQDVVNLVALVGLLLSPVACLLYLAGPANAFDLIRQLLFEAHSNKIEAMTASLALLFSPLMCSPVVAILIAHAGFESLARPIQLRADDWGLSIRRCFGVQSLPWARVRFEFARSETTTGARINCAPFPSFVVDKNTTNHIELIRTLSEKSRQVGVFDLHSNEPLFSSEKSSHSQLKLLGGILILIAAFAGLIFLGQEHEARFSCAPAGHNFSGTITKNHVTLYSDDHSDRSFCVAGVLVPGDANRPRELTFDLFIDYPVEQVKVLEAAGGYVEAKVISDKTVRCTIRTLDATANVSCRLFCMYPLQRNRVIIPLLTNANFDLGKVDQSINVHGFCNLSFDSSDVEPYWKAPSGSPAEMPVIYYRENLHTVNEALKIAYTSDGTLVRYIDHF